MSLARFARATPSFQQLSARNLFLTVQTLLHVALRTEMHLNDPFRTQALVSTAFLLFGERILPLFHLNDLAKLQDLGKGRIRTATRRICETGVPKKPNRYPLFYHLCSSVQFHLALQASRSTDRDVSAPSSEIEIEALDDVFQRYRSYDLDRLRSDRDEHLDAALSLVDRAASQERTHPLSSFRLFSDSELSNVPVPLNHGSGVSDEWRKLCYVRVQEREYGPTHRAPFQGLLGIKRSGFSRLLGRIRALRLTFDLEQTKDNPTLFRSPSSLISNLELSPTDPMLLRCIGRSFESTDCSSICPWQYYTRAAQCSPAGSRVTPLLWFSAATALKKFSDKLQRITNRTRRLQTLASVHLTVQEIRELIREYVQNCIHAQECTLQEFRGVQRAPEIIWVPVENFVRSMQNGASSVEASDIPVPFLKRRRCNFCGNCRGILQQGSIPGVFYCDSKCLAGDRRRGGRVRQKT